MFSIIVIAPFERYAADITPYASHYHTYYYHYAVSSSAIIYYHLYSHATVAAVHDGASYDIIAADIAADQSMTCRHHA